MAGYVKIFPAASTYIFGSTDETGMSTESYDQNDTCDSYEQKNGQGEVIELVTHNPRSEITLLGEVNGAITAKVGTSFTFTNFVSTYYVTPPTLAGISIIKGMNSSKGRAKNQQVRITATFYPLLAA